MGHFDVDSAPAIIFDFTIGAESVAAGYMSAASIVSALTDAINTAQVSPGAVGGTSNNTFSRICRR